MSKILSEDIVEVVTAKKKKITAIQCDNETCMKVILPRKYRESEGKYFRVMTGHNDWGNDSCESIEYRDLCPDCVGKFCSDYLKETEGTEYLEVKTEYLCDGEYETVPKWKW